MQENVSMPSSSGQSQFSIRSLVALKLKLKNFICGQTIPIAFENILDGTYLLYILDLKNDCFCSGFVHKLHNQLEALTVTANDYV